MSCWGIRHIRQRRRQAICGETPLVYSQPFCTSTNGYKTRENVSEWTWHRSRTTPVTSLFSRTSSDKITQVLEAMVAGLGTTEAVLTTASKKYVDTYTMVLVVLEGCICQYILDYCIGEYISQYIRLLCWRDASLNTLGYCIGGMHPAIQYHIVL